MNDELDVFLNSFFEDFWSRTVNENRLLYKNKMIECVDRYVPRFKILSYSNKPWFNKTLKALRNKKKRLFRAAMQVNTEHAWSNYDTYAKLYVKCLREFKVKIYTCDLPSVLKHHPKIFWKLIAPNETTNKISLANREGDTISDVECPVVINNHFASIFTHEDTSTVPVINDVSYQFVSPICVSPSGIENIIDNLTISTSAGTDTLTLSFLRIQNAYPVKFAV